MGVDFEVGKRAFVLEHPSHAVGEPPSQRGLPCSRWSNEKNHAVERKPFEFDVAAQDVAHRRGTGDPLLLSVGKDDRRPRSGEGIVGKEAGVAQACLVGIGKHASLERGGRCTRLSRSWVGHRVSPIVRTEPLALYDIEAQGPDEFVLNVLELAPARVISVIEDQARALTKPPTSSDQLLDRLRTAQRQMAPPEQPPAQESKLGADSLFENPS